MSRMETAISHLIALTLILILGSVTCQPCSNATADANGGGSCRFQKGGGLCRWNKVESDWTIRTLNGTDYVTTLMNGMNAESISKLIESPWLCATGDIPHELQFGYHIRNTSNCELSLILRPEGDADVVLWNTSRESDAAPQTVTVSKCIRLTRQFKVRFAAKKLSSNPCGTGVLNNVIGINNVVYRQVGTSPPTEATSTTSRTQHTPQSFPVPSAQTSSKVSSVTSSVITDLSTPLSGSNENTSAAPTAWFAANESTMKSVPVATDNNPGLDEGVVAGIVIGVVVAAVIAVFIIVYLRRRKDTSFLKSCQWISKCMRSSSNNNNRRGVLNSAYVSQSEVIHGAPRGNIGGQSVYELADATHLQEYANLRNPHPPGDEIPCQPQSSRRYQESGLEESVLEESTYDTTEDTLAGSNYYSVPDDATSKNNHSTTTNFVTATTTRMHQPKGDNVYELSDETNMGRNRVLPENSYNKLSHLNPRSQTPVPEGARPYNHIADDARNKTPADGSEYSLVHADDPRYSRIGEALRNTRTVPTDGNEYSLADNHNAETNFVSSTPIDSEYSLSGSHGTTDTTDIAATSAAHVDYYNTVDFNSRVNAGPMEKYNALNFDSSNNNDGVQA